jgi:hypothetical protein
MTALTAEIVVDARAPQTPAIAPNGRLLYYVLAPVSRTGDHLDTELWLVDTEAGAAPRRSDHRHRNGIPTTLVHGLARTVFPFRPC